MVDCFSTMGNMTNVNKEKYSVNNKKEIDNANEASTILSCSVEPPVVIPCLHNFLAEAYVIPARNHISGSFCNHAQPTHITEIVE